MRYGNAFRSQLYETQQENLFDLSPATFNDSVGSSWTTGKALIDTITTPTRGLSTQWTVSALSVTANVILDVLQALPMYGKLGTIYAGLSLQGPQTGLEGIQLANAPLPRDSSLIAPLFDPSSDPLPPLQDNTGDTGSAITNMLDVMATVTPPVPITVPAGANLYAGIWMDPSLLSALEDEVVAGLMVLNAQYELYYDNVAPGQGPT